MWLVALGLALLLARTASAAEPSSSPFVLVPRSDLKLSGAEEHDAPNTCSSFDRYLSNELRPAACSRVATADPAATEPSGAGPAAVVPTTLPAPFQPDKPWPYRVAPWAIPIGVFAGGLENALADSPLQSFRWVNQGYYGHGSYAGGADWASHFVDYTIVSRELTYLYQKLGYSERSSILLGSSIAVLGGFANELGDGFNQYGFSLQDLELDVFGAATTALLLATGTGDLVGFRQGSLYPRSSVTCCMIPGRFTRDYSYEILTGDLKLAAVGRRLHRNIGPLRYLLFSATYGSKFYTSGPRTSASGRSGSRSA